ncbi:unnamed protein product [Adineta steineri]|uniref:G-protein coupled receptors family 1 profile domain-containing protein n=2 Tax=Adineta steineri TaxID=433720 RepID=A0A814AI42_9BILA|nr:unnamed protein product [Adineta steineri]CAF1229796.1 unnamed protein product [Adineta steineri]
MSSLSDNVIMASLDNALIQLNRYLAVFILLFGVIGNILNIFVLSQRKLRINTCAWLFLISSIVNIIALIFGLLTRILSTWSLDVTATIGWTCKLRAFILFNSRTIAFWLITLASIDRCLLSSRHIYYRQMSTLQNAQRGFIVIVLISTIVFIHLVYCYDANQINSPLKCYGISTSCRLYSDLTFAFITVIIPLVLMSIFGSITISNVFQIKKRIYPAEKFDGKIIHKTNFPTRKTDQQLLVMLCIQIILLGIFTVPLVIQRLYTTITMNAVKSALQNKIDNFLYNFLFLLYSIANGMPFYIYTLTGGSTFRNALFKLLFRNKQKIVG